MYYDIDIFKMLSIFYFDEITPVNTYLRFISKISRFYPTNDTFIHLFFGYILLPFIHLFFMYSFQLCKYRFVVYIWFIFSNFLCIVFFVWFVLCSFIFNTVFLACFESLIYSILYLFIYIFFWVIFVCCWYPFCILFE